MPSAWIDALKKYNEGKGTWCLPKKGSEEHAEVMALMHSMKGKKDTSLSMKKDCDKNKGEDCKCDTKPAPKKTEAELVAEDRERIRKVYAQKMQELAKKKETKKKAEAPKKKQEEESKLREKHRALERLVGGLARQIKTATGTEKKKLEKEHKKRHDELMEVRGKLIMMPDSDEE